MKTGNTMSMGERVNATLGGIKTVIYGRTAMILLGFLSQLILLGVGYILLRNYSYIFYIVFLSISAIAVVYIFNAPGNPDLKLSWMLPIAIFPVFGAIFYVTIVSQPGTKVLYTRLLEQAEYTRKYVIPRAEIRDRLRAESPHMGQLAHYLEKCDNSPVYDSTQIKYYPLGDSQFVDMVEELKKAEKYIFMEFFIVSGGRMLGTILDILKEKAKQGVEVRFMYDGTNVLWNLPSFFPDILEEEGIRCKMFAPIKPVFSPHYNNRDHRKILVIDGRVAFTGGINLADEYINRKNRFGHWKDAGAMVRGDAVERFTFMFLEMWNYIKETSEDYLDYLPQIYNKKQNPADGYVQPYSDTPLDHENVGENIYLNIINHAKQYVYIFTPYLIVDNEMTIALQNAAKCGIDVRIVTPDIPDKKLVFLLTQSYYEQLIQNGVRIYQYTPGFIHAKCFVCDDKVATVGTVNLDYRSLYLHFECGVFMYRSQAVMQIKQDALDTIEKSREISLEFCKNRNIAIRAVQSVLRLFAPLM